MHAVSLQEATCSLQRLLHALVQHSDCSYRMFGEQPPLHLQQEHTAKACMHATV